MTVLSGDGDHMAAICSIVESSILPPTFVTADLCPSLGSDEVIALKPLVINLDLSTSPLHMKLSVVLQKYQEQFPASIWYLSIVHRT